MLLFDLQALKAKIKGILTCLIVAMAKYYDMKMTTTVNQWLDVFLVQILPHQLTKGCNNDPASNYNCRKVLETVASHLNR